MKKQEGDLNKQIKFLAIVMTITGIFIWFYSDSDKGIIQDLLKGMGIFLFIVGVTNISRIKINKWSELSEKQKVFKVAAIIILTLLFIAGILFAFFIN